AAGSGIACGIQAGRAVEGVHAQARIVAQRRKAGGLRRVAGLQQGVLDEAEPGLVDIPDAELRLRAQPEARLAEQLAQFDQLAGVAAGQHQVHGSARGQRGLLGREQFAAALGRELQHRVELVAAEGVAFGRALELDEPAAVVHHHVHVGVAVAVLGVVEVEHRHAAVDADRNRGHRAVDRVALDVAARLQPARRVDQGHVGAGDRGGAGAAIGLQHVAVQGDGALAQGVAVHAGAQAAPDQALDFQGAPALLAARGLAVVAGVGGARKHAVFGGDPAGALAAQEARHAVLDAGRAQHPGFAKGDQDRTLGVAGIAALDAHFAHLAGRAAAGAWGLGHVDYRWNGARVYHRHPDPLDAGMIRSMTAYASGERTTPWGTLACELRAVNHRFLEIGMRAPDELRALEPQLRERISARVSRGKLDLSLRLRPAEGAASLHVDESLLGQLSVIAQDAGARFPGLRTQFIDLLQFPGVLRSAAPEPDALQAELLALLDQVLGEFIAAREREGGKLVANMLERVDGI